MIDRRLYCEIVTIASGVTRHFAAGLCAFLALLRREQVRMHHVKQVRDHHHGRDGLQFIVEATIQRVDDVKIATSRPAVDTPACQDARRRASDR